MPFFGLCLFVFYLLELLLGFNLNIMRVLLHYYSKKPMVSLAVQCGIVL